MSIFIWVHASPKKIPTILLCGETIIINARKWIASEYTKYNKRVLYPIPSLRVGGAIQEEFGPTRGVVQLDNSLIIRNVEVVKSYLQGLLDIVTKYARPVSDNVVAPMLEAHIVQTLFFQKQTVARDLYVMLSILYLKSIHKNGL